MGTIQLLSPDIIGKIAAGEVVERPAFAVKELIENAIDANATEIHISVEEGGLKKIQVVDNGNGMNKEDLEICWKLHTTSKVKTTDNLVGIKSFGFRGEALASLAAISNLTIKSRTANNPTGNQIEVKNGKYVKSIPAGMPQGTIVIAENLFASVPARKKFLKSIQTELRHIVDVVSSFAIAYPSIVFSLQHNKRTIIDFTRIHDLQKRIKHVIGEETFSFFIPVNTSDSHISVSGYIAKPQIHSSTQSKQLLFVNNRRVSDRLVSLAVKEAFGTMLESNTYPVFILFLSIPFEMVDINVHPRKEQVAFLNHQTVFSIVKTVIMETLQCNNITFQNLSWKRAGVGTTHSFAGQLLKQEVLDKEAFVINKESPIVQFNNVYIVTQTKKGILLTDQHAAHERILFEKLSKEFLNQKRKHKIVPLENPIVLHLPPAENFLLVQHQPVFKKLGFTITTTKKNAYVVTHVPFLFQDRNPYELIKQFLTDIEQDIPLKAIDKVSEEMIAFLACRAAVKAGDKLNEEEMKKILEALEIAPNNATCPHGRPTQVLLSLAEINNLFRR